MATAKTVTYAELRASLSRKNYAPVYLIHGEEGFFIDRLVEEFEAIVPEADHDFNLYTLYGPETRHCNRRMSQISDDVGLSGRDIKRGTICACRTT